MTYYVNMTDKFMSNWGGAAGRIAKLSIRCDTFEQAEAIEQAARQRSEMRYVNIAKHAPRDGSRYQVTCRNFIDMSGPWIEFYHGV